MMKRGTPDHPKTKRLARLLCNGDLARACGLLELLWHFTARYAPDGGIGAYPNEEIADGAKWAGDADQFVQALVDSGWLNLNIESRLLVHDWPEHAEDLVHMTLCRARKLFADGTLPKLCKLGGPERAAAAEWLAAPHGHKMAISSTGDGTSPSLPSPSLPGPSLPCTRSPSDDGEQANDVEPDKPVSKQRRFQKPTPEEVAAYCKQRQSLGKGSVDPNTWYDHYEANGWKVGKVPMKDWKAAVRTWEKPNVGNNPPRVSGRIR